MVVLTRYNENIFFRIKEVVGNYDAAFDIIDCLLFDQESLDHSQIHDQESLNP